MGNDNPAGFFHVVANPKGPEKRDWKFESEYDLSFEELERRVLGPYRRGDSVVINGRTILMETLGRIRIFRSDYRFRGLSSLLHIHYPDVTGEFITVPAGSEIVESSYSNQSLGSEANTREVFVVHGRNTAARAALFAFLRTIGLHPLEWPEATLFTGKASPYIGETLDIAFYRAHAVVVLLTPDDEVRLRREFWGDDDPAYETELTGQARPNVLFEAGRAMERFPDRTVFVELGSLRPFSDVSGLHFIRMDGSSQRRQELAQRLRAAGCPVNLDGTDWHDAGNFDSAVLLPEIETERRVDHGDTLEERRFMEMLDASRQLHQHISEFLSLGNSNLTALEGQNILIALGALASQMNALGMKELHERLRTPADIITKFDRILAMLSYFEMHIVGRNFDQAKQEFANYDPDNDDNAGYLDVNNFT